MKSIISNSGIVYLHDKTRNSVVARVPEGPLKRSGYSKPNVTVIYCFVNSSSSRKDLLESCKYFNEDFSCIAHNCVPIPVLQSSSERSKGKIYLMNLCDVVKWNVYIVCYERYVWQNRIIKDCKSFCRTRFWTVPLTLCDPFVMSLRCISKQLEYRKRVLDSIFSHHKQLSVQTRVSSSTFRTYNLEYRFAFCFVLSCFPLP